MESQALNTEWVPIRRDETVRETSLESAHERSVNDQLNALMNEHREEIENAQPKTNGHDPRAVVVNQSNQHIEEPAAPQDSFIDEFPMSVEADDDAPAHDPEIQSEQLGEQLGRGKWEATINGGDEAPDLPPRAPEIKNPLLPLKIKRGQSAVAVESPMTKKARGPYKKSTKQKEKEHTIDGKKRPTPRRVPPNPRAKIQSLESSPAVDEDPEQEGRRARRSAAAKKYTFSDQEDDHEEPVNYEPEDDGGEFEIEAPIVKRKGRPPGRPKGRPPKNPGTKAAMVKAPVTPPKKAPPRGISKGPTKDTLVITKEEYKRLAGVEKAFLKVKELNREMFMIMLQETKKQKEVEEKGVGPSGS